MMMMMMMVMMMMMMLMMMMMMMILIDDDDDDDDDDVDLHHRFMRDAHCKRTAELRKILWVKVNRLGGIATTIKKLTFKAR